MAIEHMRAPTSRRSARSTPAAASCCPAWSTWRRACASRATSTRACSRARWRRRWPAASPAWSARPTPTRCSTSPAWSRCSSSAPRSCTSARLFPLGALTRGLAGEVLTEMAELTEAGCVGFSQAEVPLARHPGAAARAAVRRHLRLHGVAAAAGPRPGQGRGRQRPAGHAAGPGRRAGGGRDHRAAHHLRADEEHRRARAPVPPVQRGRRGAGARRPRPTACRSPATSASTRCT